MKPAVKIAHDGALKTHIPIASMMRTNVLERMSMSCSYVIGSSLHEIWSSITLQDDTIDRLHEALT